MTFAFHRLALLIVCLLGFYARAVIVRYIIYPKYDLSIAARQQFTAKIIALAGSQGNVYTSVRGDLIRFWCANLKAEAYKELDEDTLVAEIHVNKVVVELFTQNETLGKNATYLSRPTSEMPPSNLSASEENLVYRTQKVPAATELRALSLPSGGFIRHYPNYVYPYPARIKPTYIYHVELGINEQHEDFRGRQIEWLYTPLAKATGNNTKTEAAAGGGHSTCTASKAIGNLYGASKSATLVVVKMPTLEEDSVYEVLGTVIDDINRKRRNQTSVVSISWGSIEPVNSFIYSRTALERGLSDQLNELNDNGRRGTLLVCAAGNAARKLDHHGQARLDVDSMPAVFLRTTPFTPGRFFAVGNSDINGVRDQTSQIDQFARPLQIYAPGVDIKCARNDSKTGYTTWTGTSFSAPLVAGVIADLLSTGQYDPERQFYWRRPPYGESLVWNLVDKAHNPPVDPTPVSTPVSPSGNATLVNYTLSVFPTTGFDNEQLDVSTD